MTKPIAFIDAQDAFFVIQAPYVNVPLGTELRMAGAVGVYFRYSAKMWVVPKDDWLAAEPVLSAHYQLNYTQKASALSCEVLLRKPEGGDEFQFSEACTSLGLLSFAPECVVHAAWKALHKAALDRSERRSHVNSYLIICKNRGLVPDMEAFRIADEETESGG